MKIWFQTKWLQYFLWKQTKIQLATLSIFMLFAYIPIFSNAETCISLKFFTFQLLCTSAHKGEEIRALVKSQMSHRQALLASTYNINQFSIQCAITLLLQSWAFFLSRNCFVPCCLVASFLFGLFLCVDKNVIY